MTAETIAAILRELRPAHLESDPNDTREGWLMWACTVDEFMARLVKEDPKFNREAFYKACLADK